jgi:hypothetical protein
LGDGAQLKQLLSLLTDAFVALLQQNLTIRCGNQRPLHQFQEFHSAALNKSPPGILKTVPITKTRTDPDSLSNQSPQDYYQKLLESCIKKQIYRLTPSKSRPNLNPIQTRETTRTTVKKTTRTVKAGEKAAYTTKNLANSKKQG